jgi:predicted Zn finger-like uncharacterized protein
MIIQCDQCKTKFRLDDSKVTETGVRVRCSRCKHTFIVKKEAPEEEADFDMILQSLGGGQTDEKGRSDELSFASSANNESVQSVEGVSVPNADGTGNTACCIGGDPAGTVSEGTAKDLASEETGSAVSGIENFDFGDFPLADGAAELKPSLHSLTEEETEKSQRHVSSSEISEEQSAALLRSPDLYGNADENAEDTFFAEEFGEGRSVCSDALESSSELSLRLQLEKNTIESGIFEEKDVTVNFPDTEKAVAAECDPWDAYKDTFVGIGPEVKEESIIIPAGNQGELSETDGEEMLPTSSSEDAQQLKAHRCGDFADEADDELPPLSIASRRKGISMISIALMVAALLIILTLAATGFYFFKGQSGMPTIQGFGVLANWFKQDVKTGGEIAIKDLEGAYLVNIDEGEIFVVRGEAFNNSKKPRTAVQVKGIIYGANGKMLAEKSVYCGNVLSNDQLVTFPIGTIEKSLNNQISSSLNHLVVQSGKGIPFTIVFKNIPQGAGEFGAEILGSVVAVP